MTIRVLSATARIGGFSKPISKVMQSVAAAVADAGDRCSRSDRLVKETAGGWQVWAKRASARGVHFPSDYAFTNEGRRAKMRRTGIGQWFMTYA